MHLIHLLIGLLVENAYAAFASEGPGVSEMWGAICSTLPFCNVGTNAPELIADRGAAILQPLIVGAGVCAGIWAGIQLMRAQGSSDGIEKAKTTILHAVVGTVLMLIVLSIFRFVIYAVSWFS